MPTRIGDHLGFNAPRKVAAGTRSRAVPNAFADRSNKGHDMRVTLDAYFRLLLYLALFSAAGSAAHAGLPRKSLAWEKVSSTPRGYCPQGLTTRNERLLLSAYGSNGSAIFEWDAKTNEFTKLFDMPPEATHTSGVDVDPEMSDLMFAVDYHANKLYCFDFAASVKTRTSVLVAEIPTKLRGTSACCVVRGGNGKKILVSEFRHSNLNIFFSFDLKTKSFRAEPDDYYINHGYSQGIKYRNGHVLESGNRALSSYLVLHELKTSLDAKIIAPVGLWQGPGQGIEDIAILGDFLFTTDERTKGLYRADFAEILRTIDRK